MLILSSKQDIEIKRHYIPTSLSITASGYLQLNSVSLINYLSNNQLALFQGEWKEIEAEINIFTSTLVEEKQSYGIELNKNNLY